MVRRHVLLVDDDLQTRKTVSFMLEQAGYIVKLAEDGFAGIEKAKRLAFDLVILDINMPHMDGYTILETFQNIPEMEKMPIMMLTGRDDVKSVEKARSKGAVDYIIKPVKKEQLLQRVSNVLGTRPQFKEVHLQEGRDPQKGHIHYEIKIISVSETGMVFHSPLPIPPGSDDILNPFDCVLFQNLGVNTPRLRIVDCNEEKGIYEIYASFADMPEPDIPKIREWVIGRTLAK